jgi:L-methionine (R)-S-oxide reductase
MSATSALFIESGKLKLYREICDQMEALLGDEQNFVANAANAAALLFQVLPDVNWVGFYVADGDSLVLGPFQGKPACSRIPIGKGVCGTAAAQQETVVVANVHEFEGHIACDAASASEIVVPLLNWGRLVGVLDIDSPSLNRFDEDDREGLERVASLFVSKQRTDDLPSFNEEELMLS